MCQVSKALLRDPASHVWLPEDTGGYRRIVWHDILWHRASLQKSSAVYWQCRASEAGYPPGDTCCLRRPNSKIVQEKLEKHKDIWQQTYVETTIRMRIYIYTSCIIMHYIYSLPTHILPYIYIYLYMHTYVHTYHYITLHYITLHYSTLHYITLQYITLHTYIITYIQIHKYIYIYIYTYTPLYPHTFHRSPPCHTWFRCICSARMALL